MKRHVVYDVLDQVIVAEHLLPGDAQDEAKNRNSNIDPVDRLGHKRFLVFESDHV